MDHPIKVKSKRQNRPIASVFNCFLDGGTTVQSRAKSDSGNHPESSTPTDRSPKKLAIDNVKAPSPSLDDEHPPSIEHCEHGRKVPLAVHGANGLLTGARTGSRTGGRGVTAGVTVGVAMVVTTGLYGSTVEPVATCAIDFPTISALKATTPSDATVNQCFPDISCDLHRLGRSHCADRRPNVKK
jgi:hypothetical protein